MAVPINPIVTIEDAMKGDKELPIYYPEFIVRLGIENGKTYTIKGMGKKKYGKKIK